MLRAIIAHLKKDITIEFRGKFVLTVALSFAFIVTLSISLTTGMMNIPGPVHSLLFWVIIYFSAMNSLSHVFIREEEEGTSLFLTLNASPSLIFTAKLIFNTCILFLISLLVLPMYLFFINIPASNIALLVLFVFMGSFTLSAAVTLLAAVVAKSGGRSSLFTILSFPVAIPVLWVCINATTKILSAEGQTDINSLIFLPAFSGAIIIASYILFDYIWLDD